MIKSQIEKKPGRPLCAFGEHETGSSGYSRRHFFPKEFLMSLKRFTRIFPALAIAASLFVLPAVHAAEVTMEFFGNQHFRLVSPTGKVILINPWIKGNKDFPHKIDFYKKGEVDLILPTSGHGDDQGQSVEIAHRTGAKIFVMSELGNIMTKRLVKMGGKKSQVYRGSISGRYHMSGISVQIMNSQHGSGSRGPKGRLDDLYGGPATGFLITFENGLRVYMAGSTGLTADLQLYGERYKPHIVMVPIAGRFMMHPDDAAYAVKLLQKGNPNLKLAIPQHHRIKKHPKWMGTADQFEAEVKKLGLNVKVLKPVPGKKYTLTK
jgi:L-ascorbate metabolism protein UlaG (beta-lactamase superfamily)